MPRAATPGGSSVLENHQVQLTKALGVGDQVDFDDPPTGGKIQMPLTEQSGGASVGWLTDKFGISWAVTIDKA